MNKEDNSDLFDGFGNGSLHMYVVCTPDWKPYREGDARYLELDFHFNDWEALFFDALDAHRWDPYEEGEDIVFYTERNRRKFHESLPEFPLLRRIYDMYEDYVYRPHEAALLHQECSVLRKRFDIPAADKALRKLIYGCDKALEAKCDLMFVCD